MSGILIYGLRINPDPEPGPSDDFNMFGSGFINRTKTNIKVRSQSFH